MLGGLTLAFMLGLPLGSLAGGLYGWRACFVLAASVAALALAAMLAVMPRVVPVPGPRPSPRGLLRIPDVPAAFATTFLTFTATFCVVAFTGPLVNRVTGLSGAAVGPYQACIGLGSLAGLALGGWAADRNGRAVLPGAVLLCGVCQLAFAGLLAGWGGTTSWVLLAVTVFLSASGLFTTIPLLQARLAAIAGSATPLALAINSSLVSLGQGTGAAIGGVVRDALSFSAAGLAGALLALGATAVARRVKP